MRWRTVAPPLPRAVGPPSWDLEPRQSRISCGSAARGAADQDIGPGGAGGARTHGPAIMRPTGRVSAVICHDRRRASVQASASPWSAGVRQDLRGCYAFVPTPHPPQVAKACCASVIPAALHSVAGLAANRRGLAASERLA